MSDAHGPIARAYMRAAERWKHRALEAEAERDALAARVAAVEALWDYDEVTADDVRDALNPQQARVAAVEALVCPGCTSDSALAHVPGTCRKGDAP